MNPRILPIALLLSGCAADRGEFPSLAPRPIESRSDAIATVPAPAPQPPDPALAARIDALLGEVREGEAAFTVLYPRALAAAETARDDGVGSEDWVAAQQLLSALEGARAPTMRALGTLDTLLIAELAERSASEALRSAQTEATRVAGAQQAGVDAIMAMLAR